MTEHLLVSSFEQCLSHLKSLQSNLKGDALIEQSLLVSLDYAECERWELEYEREQRSMLAREKEYAHTAAANATSNTTTHHKPQRSDTGSTAHSQNHSWQSEPDADDEPFDHQTHSRDASTIMSM